ncbi:MAG: exodeoxyribonuclease VII large subunit [Planctomycetota bacterium]
MRLLDLDSERQELRILFPYDKRLVDVVRELPGRRWNAEGKYWSVPPKHARAVFRCLREHGFVISPEAATLMGEGDAGSTPDTDPDPLVAAVELPEVDAASPGQRVTAESRDPATPEAAPACTVVWLNRAVREVLNEAFPEPLWLVGEIHGFDRNRHKKHVYFQLADRNEDEDRPSGVVTAVLFASAQERVAQRLRSAADPIELQDGLRVRVLVRVDLYPAAGTYQVVIEDLDPYYTLGEIARRQEQILAEVRRRGWLDANRTKPFPRPTLRIGLITSYDSDAYNDFVNELERSRFAFEVDSYDCHVQGARTEEDVLRALRFFEAHAQDYDALVIVRGGGSKTDLLGFDSLALALAVAQHPLKVVIGIGHHRDRSVLDALAHAEKTPTAVAQTLVALARAEEQQLREAARLVVEVPRERLRRERERRSRVALLLARSLQLGLERAFSLGRARAQRLHVHAGRFLERERQRCYSRAQQLNDRGRRIIERRRERLGRWLERLPARAREALRRATDRAERQKLRVESADPRRVLARGYAWLRTPGGESLKSVEQVHPDQRIVVRLADGEFEALAQGTGLTAMPERPAASAAKRRLRAPARPASDEDPAGDSVSRDSREAVQGEFEL